LLGRTHVDEQIVVLAGFEPLSGVRGEELADMFTANIGYQYLITQIPSHLNLHLESLEEHLYVGLHSPVVGQSRQSTNVYAAARVTVDLGKARSLLLTPAIDAERLRRILNALLRLGHTGLDLDRATQHIAAIELSHGALGMLLVLQVDEAVRRVPAGERVNGNIYALAIWRGVFSWRRFNGR
jgi:hypothetical protein